MRASHLFTLAALLVATAACKPDAANTERAAADAQTIQDNAAADGAAGDQQIRRQASTAAAPGGAFAREPGFQLPVAVSTTPVRANNIPQSRQVDPVGVRTAVMEGLDASSGANVQVQVSPRGIVSLSGDVGSTAELQHLHYLARAQPGVVEVDYRNLRVRQR